MMSNETRGLARQYTCWALKNVLSYFQLYVRNTYIVGEIQSMSRLNHRTQGTTKQIKQYIMC